MNESQPALFTFSFYAEILECLRSQGFTPALIGAAVPSGSRPAFLRHDIDFSIVTARAFAEREAALGARSTYYCLLDTEFYNPHSARDTRELRRIASLGHAIGLHVVPGPADRLEEQIRRECRILQDVAGVPVRTYSFHKPTPGVLNSQVRIEGLVNAYGPELFSPELYVSDSSHHWRCGNPLDFIRASKAPRIQLLTHPIWWTDAPQDRMAKLKGYLRSASESALRHASETVGVEIAP